MIKSISALFIGASLLASVPANAAVLVVKFSGSYDNGIFLPAFERATGTIQSVDIFATYSEYSTATRFGGDAMPAASLSFERIVDIRAQLPQTGSFILVPSVLLQGTKTFEAGSSIGSCSATASGSATIDQANVGLFYGSGTGSVFTTTRYGSTGCDSGIKPQGVISGTLTYTYDETTPGPVPEPATWAMMIVGFAITGMALHRKVGIVRHA